MSKKVVNELLKDGIIVVFDVDGVLAPYEWGTRKHSLSDEKWTEMSESGEDMYSHIQPVKTLQNFIKNKNINEVYVCSKAEPAELKSKMAFCIREYGIMPDHIKCVRKKSEKVVFLDGLSEKLGIPQCNIALVEDTVETLDSIAQTRDYFTVHISSFME